MHQLKEGDPAGQGDGDTLWCIYEVYSLRGGCQPWRKC